VNKLLVVIKRLSKWLANLDIRVKIIGLAVGSVLVLGAVATLYMYSYTSRTLGQELIHESHDVAEELSEELVHDIKTPLLIDDPGTVQLLLNNTLKSDTMVRYAFITDMSGNVLFDTFTNDLPAGLSTANNLSTNKHPKVQIINTGGRQTWDAAFPITIGPRTDVIRIGYSDEDKKAQLNSILAEQILVTAGMATLVLIVAFLLGSFLARQIKVLAQAASAVAKGDMGAQVKVFSRDALGQLAH
jgi:sensor histidine kinase regulating citrate/malate metabolism